MKHKTVGKRYRGCKNKLNWSITRMINQTAFIMSITGTYCTSWSLSLQRISREFMHVYHDLINYSKMGMTLHKVHCSIIYECIESIWDRISESIREPINIPDILFMASIRVRDFARMHIMSLLLSPNRRTRMIVSLGCGSCALNQTAPSEEALQARALADCRCPRTSHQATWRPSWRPRIVTAERLEASPATSRMGTR